MSEVIVLQHIGCEGLGTIAGSLAARKLSVRNIRSFDGQKAPLEMGKADALIVMGGPMGVYEEDLYPYLRDELHLIENALSRGKPVLGICLGSQLIAKALGAEVRKGPRKEIGWHRVRLSAAAREDAIFSGAPAEFTALHWHGDIFDLPHGATALASSDLTANQAYRWGEKAYGILFHIEITEAMLGEWVKTFGDELASEKLDGDSMLREASGRLEALRPVSAGVFERWTGLIR